MRVIRHLNFLPETSSSSRHTITVPSKRSPSKGWKRKVFVLEPGEYRADGRVLTEPQEILEYFAAQAHLSGVLKSFLDHLDVEDVEVLVHPEDCLVDHQSRWELVGDVGPFLADLASYLINTGRGVALIWDGEFDPEDEEVDPLFRDVFPVEGVVWKNGNYYVFISTKYDFLKMRIAFHDDPLKPRLPETLDVKITDRCRHGCPFCSEGSTPNGQDSKIPFLPDYGSPYIEVVFGGGNPLESEYLNEVYLWPQAAITVRDVDILSMKVTPPVPVLGISVSDPENVKALADLHYRGKWFRWQSKVVLHFINGVHSTEDVLESMKRAPFSFGILILGFKEMGRGKTFNRRSNLDVEKILKEAEESLMYVGWDTLAVQQLRVKDYIEPSLVPFLWGGDDGEFSMFLDLVKLEAWDSSSRRVGPIEPNPEYLEHWTLWEIERLFKGLRIRCGFDKE